MSRRAEKYHTCTGDVCNEVVRNSTDAVGAKLSGLPPQHSQKELYSLQFRNLQSHWIASEVFQRSVISRGDGINQSATLTNSADASGDKAEYRPTNQPQVLSHSETPKI